MRELFSTLLSMSGSASIVILAVLLVRLLLRRAPKIFSHVLWAVVLFRLLCPVTMESTISLIPSARLVSSTGEGDSSVTQVIQIETGLSAVDNTVNNFFAEHSYQTNAALPMIPNGECGQVQSPLQQQGNGHWSEVLPMIWVTGVAVLLLYSITSLLLLRRRLIGAVPLECEAGVWLADHIDTPFVLGLFRPKIYLPSDLPGQELDYILLHERTHIRRLDHIFRILAWLALTIHWFNPMVWLAFYLAGKDVEMSCDEAVLRRMNRDVRVEYSSSLLRLSTGKWLQAGPLAFGSGNPQDRIKNVLNYKKSAFGVIIAALVMVLMTGVALATDRLPAPESPFGYNYWAMATEGSSPNAPAQVRLDTGGMLHICDADGIWQEIGVLEETKLDKWIFLRYLDEVRAGQLRRGNYTAWQFVLEVEGDPLHNGEFWCLLQQKDGSLYLAAGWYDPDREDWPGVEDSTVYWVARLEKDETPADVHYYNSEDDGVIISGYDVGHYGLEWKSWDYRINGWQGILSAHEPSFLDQFFKNSDIMADVRWIDESRSTLRVSFSFLGPGEVDPGTTPMPFTVDLSTGTVTEDHPLVGLFTRAHRFTDYEMLTMARTFANIMQGAEKWYEAQDTGKGVEG